MPIPRSDVSSTNGTPTREPRRGATARTPSPTAGTPASSAMRAGSDAICEDTKKWSPSSSHIGPPPSTATLDRSDCSTSVFRRAAAKSRSRSRSARCASVSVVTCDGRSRHITSTNGPIRREYANSRSWVSSVILSNNRERSVRINSASSEGMSLTGEAVFSAGSATSGAGSGVSWGPVLLRRLNMGPT